MNKESMANMLEALSETEVEASLFLNKKKLYVMTVQFLSLE